MHAAWGVDDVLVAENLPLPVLGALLARCGHFLGHDSGISHLAAAVGTSCTLLFGPTDPDIWAPPYPDMEILRAPGGFTENLTLETVRFAVDATLAKNAWRR